MDQPTPMSQNALIFTVTTIGTGSGIRADADTPDCATPPPGTTLGIGG